LHHGFGGQGRTNPSVPMKRGKAEKWTESDLDKLIEISDKDIQRAAVMWRTNAPEVAMDLLDAKAEDIGRR
jgi:hypothetical protein